MWKNIFKRYKNLRNYQVSKVFSYEILKNSFIIYRYIKMFRNYCIFMETVI